MKYIENFQTYQSKKINENYYLQQEYIKKFGYPETDEEHENMKEWIEERKEKERKNYTTGKNFDKGDIKKDKPPIKKSTDEVERLANTGEHDRRLKTWEGLNYKKQQLKQRWIEQNGPPQTDDDMERMLYYIKKMMEQEDDVPLNTAGEMTRQIPSYSSKID